uniref:REJ domain-containing protein n=1 Tax=Macrostomum lignano TaxID=282301 RepID=A0A1I8GAT7_9PLAT
LGKVSKQLLSGQRLFNATLECPSKWETFYLLACHLTIAEGGGISTTVDWADGNFELFPLADAPWQRAGYPVATVDGGLQQQQADAQLLLSGAEFSLAGWLQSFELFASKAGSITLIIFRPNCSSGSIYCTRQDACNPSATCSMTIDLNSTYVSKRQNATQTYSAAAIYPNVTVSSGYNRFVPSQHGLNEFEVLPGDRVGFQTTDSDL